MRGWRGQVMHGIDLTKVCGYEGGKRLYECWGDESVGRKIARFG